MSDQKSGLRGIKTVRDFEVENKVVFLRLDLNVPMEKGKITDYTRIDATLPTINYLIEKGAKIVMASHLGRPKTSKDKEFSLEPVAKAMTERLNKDVLLVEDPNAKAVKQLLHTLNKEQIILLENVRFESGETEDSEEFATRLASYTDIYINDAFGASHRAHATIHALPAMIPNRGIGFLIEKEIQMLDGLLVNPKRPYVAILGGAKVSDKIGIIEKLMDVVDAFIIGGAMAYTFLKAQGHFVGKSRVEDDKVKYAKELLARIDARNKTILLPVDHLVTKSITDTVGASVKKEFGEGEMGVDIGPESLRNFSALIKEAGTIFWNGPMGVFETPEFSKGTFNLAKVIAESKGTKIIGGGDSAAAAEQSGFADKMTHISTGGGASLEYLQGDKLPGLEVLRFKVRS
ncbi:MAG: phosphoglycerate kinase [Bdellovibrionaceae bacterium]|nr:phosphoglycerate kinase [Pseudobdellovibrionaceae bacterium]